VNVGGAMLVGAVSCSSAPVMLRVLDQAKAPMATKDLRELLHKYKTAYTSYMSCVQSLSEATLREWPSPDLLGKEERVLQELISYGRPVGRAIRAQPESPKSEMSPPLFS